MNDVFLKHETALLIDGSVGDLELLVNGVAGGKFKGVAIICHPHPQFGGTMDNKVVYTLVRAFRDEGIATVRFNFRGVGCSTVRESDTACGSGIGELDDLRTVLAWVKHLHVDLPLWLAGFSFGGAVAACLARDNTAELVGCVLVSPALGRYGFSIDDSLSLPCLLVQGEADEVLAPQIVFDWYQRHQSHAMSLVKLARVGHFYHGQLPALKRVVENFITIQ